MRPQAVQPVGGIGGRRKTEPTTNFNRHSQRHMVQVFFITDLCIALCGCGKNNIRGQTRKDFFIACTAWIENKIFVSKKTGGLLIIKLHLHR